MVGEETKGVGVTKDEEIKVEEIEVSHTLGGYRRCRCYSVVRYTKRFGCEKKPWTCPSESEDHDHGVGASTNT